MKKIKGLILKKKTKFSHFIMEPVLSDECAMKILKGDKGKGFRKVLGEIMLANEKKKYFKTISHNGVKYIDPT